MMRAWILCLLALFSPVAMAEINAMPMPGDTKLVTFNYDPNDTFLIFTRPYAVTDIELEQDEEIVAVALGETVQWRVEEAANHIFIKPTTPNIFTSATIVTSKRTYQITLRSSPLNGKWYQKVSWTPSSTSLVLKRREQAVQASATQLANAAIQEGDNLSEGMIAFDKLNFGYSISGNSEFKPLQVMDDGKFTWIRMPSNIQELPALFAKTSGTELELVNFTVKRDYMIAHRIAKSFVLKVGKDEVRIERDGSRNRGTKGWTQ